MSPTTTDTFALEARALASFTSHLSRACKSMEAFQCCCRSFHPSSTRSSPTCTLMIHRMQHHLAFCRAVDAAAVSITNPRWGPALEGLVKEVLETFGIDRKDASFELVKLSFESAGDTRPPSPTSKTSSSQFGTIEIQFPSIFTGGSRTILHDGWRRSFSMGADDSSCHHECFFAAWYDGCQHSQQSLEQGCRLVATYSLLWKGAGDPPRAPAMLAAEQLANALANTTRRFGFFLCSGSSGFRDLKGRDRQLVGLLMAASAKMEQENPGDVLELHICTAATVEQDEEVSFWP